MATIFWERDVTEVFVCKSEEIAEGHARIIECGDIELGVIRHDGQFYAYRNVCPHQGGPACEGLLMPRVVDRVRHDGSFAGQTFDEADMHIVCPWHGYEFHLATGEHVANRGVRLQKFAVTERDGGIYVAI